MASRALKHRRYLRPKNGKAVGLGILSVILATIFAIVVSIISILTIWTSNIPEIGDLSTINRPQTTTVYASDGETILAEFQLEDRDPVSLDKINEYAIDATIAIEDERFYEHDGVDYFGIGRALLNNIAGGSIEGASTITQQLVRNTIIPDEMNDITLERKIREMILSWNMEEKYTKDEILLMYLNTVNYGDATYGIESAAQKYFSKPASELTINEAATLAGIPQSPKYNNPIDHMDNCVIRRNYVLLAMKNNGYITEDEYKENIGLPIELNVSYKEEDGILSNPYFTSYVRNVLTDPDGKYAFSTNEVFKGGLKIYTTIDLDIQADAEAAAKDKMEEVGDPYEVALVAIDPDNGYIKAMVGGFDYDNNQVNMATGEGGTGRQCGSSFKTFTLLTAIENGISPDTIIDAGTTVTYPEWKVSNISNHDYGWRSIASAFAVSSNTAFARLCMSLGPDSVAEMAHRVGIDSDLPEVGSLTLGVASVTPLEMAEAYATIANGGIHYEPECITKIVNSEGETIIDNSEPQGERVIAAETAYAALQVMEGVVTSGTGTAARLSNGQIAAGKTGTTENYKDSWFCGVTPQMSVAIWLGDRNDYQNAKPIYQTATSVFSDFLDRVLDGQEKEDFPKADTPQYNKSFYDSKNHIGGNENGRRSGE